MQGIRGDNHDDDSDDADNDGDDTDLFYANSHGDKGPRRGKTAAHNTVHSTAARSTAQIIKAANGTEHCQCIVQPSHRRTDDTLGATAMHNTLDDELHASSDSCGTLSLLQLISCH